MRAWIQSTTDFDYEVIDITLCIEDKGTIIYAWLKGFDDIEWEQAKQFAQTVATMLHCEYIGEVV